VSDTCLAQAGPTFNECLTLDLSWRPYSAVITRR